MYLYCRTDERRSGHIVSGRGSTCESEFIALSKGFNTIEWLRSFLAELHIPQRPTIVHDDNDVAIKIGRGSSYNATSRHVFVRYSRVREFFQEQLVQLQYVPTRYQLADGLTKNLPNPNFTRHLPLLLDFSPDQLNPNQATYRREYKKFITSTPPSIL